MNKDKKWLLHEVRKLPYDFQGGYSKFKAVDILPLLGQLDEPEKIVIPQFIADWWERDGDSVTMYGRLRVEKKHKFDLVSIFYDKGLGDYLSKVEDWIYENNSIFLDLVNGKVYEVEKEKLYYVLNKKGFLMMRKYEGEIDTMRISNTISIDRIDDASKYLLTEQEIKDYDPRYWSFAVEVAE